LAEVGILVKTKFFTTQHAHYSLVSKKATHCGEFKNVDNANILLRILLFSRLFPTFCVFNFILAIFAVLLIVYKCLYFLRLSVLYLKLIFFKQKMADFIVMLP
jgi:hypothetical protein